MMMMFLEPTITLYVVLPTIIFTIWAQFNVKVVARWYLKKNTNSKLSGAEIAQDILRKNKVHDVRIEMIRGKLNDHFDPKSKTIRLSTDVYKGNTVGAVGIAAHEAGHALQYANGYLPIKLRSLLVPFANFGSNLGPFLAVFGFLFYKNQNLIMIGIGLFAFSVAFNLITLPVELNASRRAKKIIKKEGYLSKKETRKVSRVLRAAALTYVAAALVSIAHLIRLSFFLIKD